MIYEKSKREFNLLVKKYGKIGKNMKYIYKKIVLFLALCIPSVQIFTGEFQSGHRDPYAGIKYSQVFDQANIYEKYQTLLQQLGCAQNVFTPEQVAAIPQIVLTEAEVEKQVQQFEQECLAQLQQARQIVLARPCIMNCSKMGLTIATMLAAKKITEMMYGKPASDNDASSLKPAADNLAMFFSASDLIWRLSNLVVDGYSLLNPPDNLLEELENHFAQNKCYIPHVLWPKITTSFVAARAGGYGQEGHINFLTFVLNLTIYKPKKAIVGKDSMSLDDVKHELHKRIETYFADYQKDNFMDSLINLQLNVAKFIDELVEFDTMTPSQGPRYIFLQGIGGIGKTHFVQTLASWIEELLPNSVRFEEMVMNSSDELEGNEQKPAAFLKILRNQLMQNKRGSVVMFDEATWLNDHCMINAAKRVFNGDRSRLTTSYFGSNIDGTAVALNIPPMLIFVASNDPINDLALASRFDVIQYPKPNKEALVHHAVKAANHSKALQNNRTLINQALITEWVEKLSENDRNFRYVAGNVEAYLLRQLYTN